MNQKPDEAAEHTNVNQPDEHKAVINQRAAEARGTEAIKLDGC
ncbi:MAG: hypothetical protein ACTXOO_01150 [Sodalis sp. (in: enterobacteria)]